MPADEVTRKVQVGCKIGMAAEKVSCCVQSLGLVNKANIKELKPLMARLDTVLRSLLADFASDKAGAWQIA